MESADFSFNFGKSKLENPGVSTINVELLSSKIRLSVVVCFPLSVFSLISPVLSISSQSRLLIRVDFPTPLGPVKAVIFPLIYFFSSESVASSLVTTGKILKFNPEKILLNLSRKSFSSPSETRSVLVIITTGSIFLS